jgi:hypothetical protein
MQPTLLLLWWHVLNAYVPTQMHLKVKANTFMNKPLIMNKIHYIIVGSDLVHVHVKCGNQDMWQNEHVFPIPKLKPILNHPY